MDMKITRGTTPTFNFILPFSYDVDDIRLTFMQNGQIIKQYGKDDMTITPILTETENSDIVDENYGDEFISNDYDTEYPESGEPILRCSGHRSGHYHHNHLCQGPRCPSP